MKVGILTFHKAQNYGAYLQCYSLLNKLSEIFPDHDFEVIDYSSKNLVNDYEKNFRQKIFAKSGSLKPPPVLVAKRFVKYLLTLGKQTQIAKDARARKKNFEAVLNKLTLSKESLITDDAVLFSDFLNGKYDVIIVGSDAIWNDNQTSVPNLYFLHDIKNCVKFSYAASTYGMDYSKKTSAEIEYIKESLEDFSFIGTRDTVSENFVEMCVGSECGSAVGEYEGECKGVVYHTCDPGIFLELEKLPTDMEMLKKKLISAGVDFSKPIIGFMCDDWLAKQVRKNLGDGYQYVSVYTRNGYEDVFLAELEPFEWARVFSFFDATFTHFFHGTMFSLKNGTQTFSVEKPSIYKKKYETKIQDLLKRLSLYDDCYYELEKADGDAWKRIAEKISNADKTAIREKYASGLKKESECINIFIEKLREVLS